MLLCVFPRALSGTGPHLCLDKIRPVQVQGPGCLHLAGHDLCARKTRGPRVSDGREPCSAPGNEACNGPWGERQATQPWRRCTPGVSSSVRAGLDADPSQAVQLAFWVFWRHSASERQQLSTASFPAHSWERVTAYFHCLAAFGRCTPFRRGVLGSH